MKYREDIDCLRGISVLSVVLYHLKFKYFSGGYLGVDIFFVISGFLITSLIFNEIKSGNFSLISFYERRIRRLFPALIFVLSVTYIFFNGVYFEKELKSLSNSILSSLLFYANFYFLNLGSYFSPTNESLPLLHMWSLSIEEQFYLFFPFLIILFKKNFKFIFRISITIALISLLLSQLGGNLKFNYPYIESDFKFFSVPGFAFYSTFTRIWEILFGCITAIYINLNKNKLENHYLTFFGYLLIFYSIFNFNENTKHPSILTLIPVIGTFFILAFSNNSFNKKGIFVLVNNHAFLNIGLISYSLYLWHQPIYQYLNLVYLINFTILDKFLIILLMIILSFLSFWFIEKPFRKKKISKNKTYFSYLFISFSAILFCLKTIFLSDFSKKYPKEILEISDHSNYYISNDFSCSANAEKYISPKNACILGNKNKLAKIALIGDSHLDLISLEFSKLLFEKNLSAIQYSYGGCMPTLNLKVFNDNRYLCHQYFKEVLSEISKNKKIKKIVLLSRWSFNLTGERFNNLEGGKEIGKGHYFVPVEENRFLEDNERMDIILREIEKFVLNLVKKNKEVYVVLPIPEMGWEIPNNLARQIYLKRDTDNKTLSISKSIYDERNQKIINFFKYIKKKYNVMLVYPSNTFCDKRRCYAHINNVPLYFDDDHMSKEGAKLVSNIVIKKLLN